MDFPAEAESRMVQIFNIYGDLNRKPYEYCEGVWLYPTEVHAVEFIGRRASPSKLSDIAAELELTKGAISKMAVKLEKLGLVRRYKYVTNQKEVYLELTPLGRRVIESHSAYHQPMRAALREYFDRIPVGDAQRIFEFIGLYREQMERLRQLKGETP